ncbi:MAG: FAD-dependent monooxygenase [Sneathiellaceae bacterium]
MTAIPATTVPVVILGAGPVGLALANDLGWRGLPYLLVDRASEALDFPTSEAIFSRTMEHFRRWGVADAIRNGGFPPDMPRNVYFMTRILGHELLRLDRPSNREQHELTRDVSPEGPLWCPKRIFDPLLRQHLGTASCGRFLTGWEMISFEQDEAGIDLVLQDVTGGERQAVRCQYLAACDGASSGVRKSLGIGMQGNFAEGHNLGIYFRSAAVRDAMAGRPGVMADIVNPVRGANLSTVDGDTLWRLVVFVRDADATALDPRQCIRDAIGGDLPVEIIDARPWAGHTVVADSWRRDRVFLVGDAAHLLWPRGGFGMNTGIGDAVDLGWKLAACHEGWGGKDLLDSYEAERKPVAARNVAEAASNYRSESSLPIPADLEEDSAAGAQARAMLGATIREKRAGEWRSLGIQLGYIYAGSPICCDDGTSLPAFDPARYDPTTYPGARAPHAWLRSGQSLLDLYGRGFHLMHDPASDPGRFLAAAADRSIPLHATAYETPAIAALYERAFVLVRPDGHVAWRSDRPAAEPGAVLDRASGRA